MHHETHSARPYRTRNPAPAKGPRRQWARQRPDISIREAQREDSEALTGIYNQAILSGRSTMDTQPVDTGYFEALLGGRRREAILVAAARKRVIAWGIVKQYSDRPGYQYACETSVYVANAHQGRGYGSTLLTAVVARAQALGYRHLVAKILAVNESSIRFHEHFNFEIVGQQRAIGFLNGTWHDVVIMQRVLDDSQHQYPRECTDP